MRYRIQRFTSIINSEIHLEASKVLNASITFSSHLIQGSMLIYMLCQSSGFPNIEKRGKDTLILLQRLHGKLLEGVCIGQAHTDFLKIEAL